MKRIYVCIWYYGQIKIDSMKSDKTPYKLNRSNFYDTIFYYLCLWLIEKRKERTTVKERASEREEESSCLYDFWLQNEIFRLQPFSRCGNETHRRLFSTGKNWYGEAIEIVKQDRIEWIRMLYKWAVRIKFDFINKETHKKIYGHR